jgi:hypothetical protein
MIENSLITSPDLPLGCADEQRPRCKCGAEPAPGWDECVSCEAAFCIANPAEYDDNYDRGFYDSAAGREVVAIVTAERLRRLRAGVRVYGRCA